MKALASIVLVLAFSAFFTTAAPAWGLGDFIEDTIELPGEIFDDTRETVEDTIDQTIEDIGNAPESWSNCLRDVEGCGRKNFNRLLTLAIWPAVEAYRQHLFSQGDGRWQSLPDWFVARVQNSYPGADLRAVRYAEYVNTVHGQNITWESSVFLVDEINFSDPTSVELMLHELEHVVQYNRRGGYKAFISEYLLDGAASIVECQCFNVHDSLNIEQAANAKASQTLQVALQVTDGNNNGPGPRPGFAQNVLLIHNRCQEPIKIAVGVLAPDGRWSGAGFYTFNPGELDSLDDGFGSDIYLLSPQVLFYSTTTSGGIASGPYQVDVNGEYIPMRPAQIFPDGQGNFVLPLC